MSCTNLKSKPVLAKHNLSKHESTEMKPIDRKKESNELLIWWSLHNKAKKERRYPESKQGDEVRVMIQKQHLENRQIIGGLIKHIAVIAVTDNDYLINDGKRRLCSRHELLKA